MVWRSGTDAGRPGHNGYRVGESILVTWKSQNLSRGSGTLWVEPRPDYVHFPDWLERLFYEELTAETRGNKGWDRIPGSANESFDLMGYCKALVQIKLSKHYQSEINWNDPPIWAQDWDTNSEIYGAVPKTEDDPQKPKQPMRRVRMRMRR